MRPKSVKLRLTLWYSFVLTVFLSVFAFLMFTELSRALYSDVERNLYTTAKQLDESLRLRLFTNAKVMKGVGREDPNPMRPFDEETRSALSQAVEYWEGRFQMISRAPILIRVLDLNHQALSSNLKGWEQEIIFPDFERDSIFMETGYAYLTIHFEKNPIRLYYYTIKIRDKPVLIVQAGYELHEIENILNRLAFIILLAIPIAVIFAFLAGWVMVKQFFKPVDNMTREARQITAAYLNSRLPRTFTGDELDRLASTLNEMMDRIELSTRAVREFSSDVSHELKTPLAIIKGELDLAFRRARSREELDQALKVIDGEVEEMIALVTDLMVLVRSESGQIQFEKKNQSLDEIAEQVFQRFKDKSATKGVRYAFSSCGDAPIVGDIVYLKRMMSNLIDNAIKFTPPQGKIDVSVAKDAEGCLSFTVKDTGIGMPFEIKEKIFSRFYRGEKARAQEGSGLGMSIVKAVADAHDIKISIESSEGLGTSISLGFPR